MEHKSKEEILAAKDWNSEYPNYMAEHEILDAMDDWAEQVAISFAEWLDGEGYECFLHTDEGVKHWHDIREKGNYTTPQLYTLFLTHQSI